MRKEIENILRESFDEMAGCKHLPCPDEGGCLECARDRIRKLFADKVRRIEVQNRRHCTIDEELGFYRGVKRLRDRLLKEASNE